MAELAFESLLLALEATRGTAVDPPTHYLNMAGTITPKQGRYRPDESRGTLEANYRSKTVRRWSELAAEGPLDNLMLPVLGHMVIDGSVTPTTPGGGTLTRDWTLLPTITADDIKSATMWFGDPNVQSFQSKWMMLDELVITSDNAGMDGIRASVKGQGHFPVKDAPNSLPAQLIGPLFTPGESELWLDTSSAIGTTAVAARFIATTITIPTGVTYKWHASGAGSTLNHTGTGRTKRFATLRMTFELLDSAQYDLFADSNGDTVVKARVRFNGPIIEGALRHQVTYDTYGPADMTGWGVHQQSNRTIELEIQSELDATLGASFQLVVRNNRAAL